MAKLFNFNFGKRKPEPTGPSGVYPTGLTDSNPSASFGWSGTGGFGVYGQSVYTGEKNNGSVGLIRDYKLDYNLLSRRANQFILTNDIAKLIIKRYTKWIISSGLTLESNPNREILGFTGIENSKERIEKFNDRVEAYFNMYSKSKSCDFRGINNLFGLQRLAFRAALVNSDVLVVLRVKNRMLKIELIDTQRLINPIVSGDELMEWDNGVRRNNDGEIIEYCVSSRTADNGYVRIKAKNSNGLMQAYLFKLDQFRLEDARGLSALSGSMDTLAQADRFKDAAIGAAEERAKIPYTIEHDLNGSGENPIGSLAAALSGDPEQDSMAVDMNGQQLQNLASATFQKSVLNLPQGAKLSVPNISSDNGMGNFIDTAIDITAAQIGIPPNVAKMLYNDSFSASRAAINDWMHTIRTDRELVTSELMMPIYEMWLWVELQKGNIVEPNLLHAFNTKDEYIIRAYANCTFVGEMFPHIDPLKEVNAERAKLGPAMANIPLTTVERAISQLGNRDSDSVIQQAESEYNEYTKIFGIGQHAEKNAENTDSNK